ncbi:CheR family methyltransferase [Thiohalobacter sp.]|uniref:CheR family methyltransferase n=1 Tax=Thiohalobacter sp. TaxID=2025948 RepID=UPI0026301AF6|nr:CheR family methyltransferase [Thiohalobacter sp.]
MSLERITRLLQRTMGLNAASVGRLAIARPAETRMQALGLPNLSAYADRLESDGAELERLIEAVVIPETWFFRDSAPFEALARLLQERIAAHPGRAQRILSLPCSTGEEPYSIAMLATDLGLPASKVTIDAVDISEQNLCNARRGRYRDNAFRVDDLSFRDRHFRAVEDGYELDAAVRARVRFRCANLFDPDFARDRERYDIIFCRNLLIYFDRETQARAITILESLLLEDGLLFIGHAESGALARRAFVPLKHPRSFAFRRGTAPTRDSSPPVPARPRPWKPWKPRRQPTPPATLAQAAHPQATRAAAPPAPDERLADARALADEGHLAEAAQLCEEVLAERHDAVDAYLLLAVIRNTAGEPDDAEALLRKALYLDPGHCEALALLALLLERGQRHEEALGVRRRLERSQRRRPEAS